VGAFEKGNAGGKKKIMAEIRETLTLADHFSESFHTFIELGNKAVQTTQQLDKSVTHALGRSAGATIGAIRNLGKQTEQTNLLLSQIVQQQQRHTQETKKTERSASRLLSTFKRIAAAMGTVSLVKSFLGFSDTQTQIHARLNLMNDGLQSTDRLNEMIYQSALRSRAAYASTADAVAKMGLNAGNAFQSNEELIAFMEAVNKQFAIGGGSVAAMDGAMVQLTQAMSSGALRGEELNSILDAAPGIARNIEQYMGWAAGSIKKYAEDGKITAEVVKYAMLDAADSINEQFNSMPMTLSQAMVQIRNVVQHNLQDAASEWNAFIQSADGQRVLNEMIVLFSMLAQVGVDALSFIGQGSMLAADNLDFILPVLGAIGIGLAILHAQAIATAAGNVAGALATAAGWALAHWQVLLLIAVLAGALVAAQQFGLGMQEVGGFVGQVFGMIYAVGYNVFATLWNVIAAFAEFFANVFNHPVSAAVHLFSDALDAILSMVETVAGAIDALTGSNLQGAVSGWRNSVSGWVDQTFGENAVQIKRMANLDIGSTAAEWGQYGSNLGAKLDNMNLNLEDIAGSFGGFNLGDIPTGGQFDVGNVGKVGSIKNVEGDIHLADEDLKLYRDLAERRYMNRIELKTLAPNINVTLPAGSSGRLEAQDVADTLKMMLIEQMNAQTAVAHG
jgi:tape measure domain-containing protein